MNACYRFATGRVKLARLVTTGDLMPWLVVVRYYEANGHGREAELRATSDYYNGARVYREDARGSR